MINWRHARELFETAPLWRMLAYACALVTGILLIQLMFGGRSGQSTVPPPPPVAIGGGSYRSLLPPPNTPAAPAPPAVAAPAPPSATSPTRSAPIPESTVLRPRQQLPADLLPPPAPERDHAVVPESVGGPLRPRINLGD